MSELIIRSIAKDDVFACLAIYNYEVDTWRSHLRP